MKKFFQSNDGLYRTLRTIAQLVIAYLCTEGTELLASLDLGSYESIVLGLYTVILVPIFKLIREELEEEDIEEVTDLTDLEEV